MQQKDQRVNRGELDLAWELTCGELQKAVYTNSDRVLFDHWAIRVHAI
jgi:hypothetical protein